MRRVTSWRGRRGAPAGRHDGGLRRV